MEHAAGTHRFHRQAVCLQRTGYHTCSSNHSLLTQSRHVYSFNCKNGCFIFIPCHRACYRHIIVKVDGVCLSQRRKRRRSEVTRFSLCPRVTETGLFSLIISIPETSKTFSAYQTFGLTNLENLPDRIKTCQTEYKFYIVALLFWNIIKFLTWC